MKRIVDVSIRLAGLETHSLTHTMNHSLHIADYFASFGYSITDGIKKEKMETICRMEVERERKKIKITIPSLE